MAANRERRADRGECPVEFFEEHILVRPAGDAQDIDVSRVFLARGEARDFGLKERTLRLL